MHSCGLATALLLSLSILPLTTYAQGTPKVVTTITLAAPTTPPSAEYTNPPTFKSAVLNSTNTFRHQHDAFPLVWNDTLTSFAEKAAEPCKFAHTGGPYGENIAQGYVNVTMAVDFWGQERSLYDFNKGEFATQWGHFTQLVWQNTTDVGCGVKDCGKDGGWLLFCEYSPRGNILRQFVDNVKKQSNSEVGVFNTSRASAPSGGTGAGGARPTTGGTSSGITLVSQTSRLLLMLSIGTGLFCVIL